MSSSSRGEMEIEVVNVDEGEVISNAISINLEDYIVSKEELKRKGRRVRQFYSKQNDLIEAMIEDTDPNKVAEKSSKKSLLPVSISFGVNVFLLIIKIIAAVLSLSMVVIASAVDSLLDILSGLVLFITGVIARKKNKYKYPHGRIGIEPIGVVIFSSVMATASFQVLLESSKVLFEAILTQTRYIPTINYFTMAVLALTIVLKTILFFYCLALRGNRRTEAVKALQNDHRNDILTNTLGSIFVILGYFFQDFWFLDPFGGILYSLYTIYSWASVAIEQIRVLSGRSSDNELQNRITYLAATSDERILHIEKIHAIQTGSGSLVEIHIVLPGTTLLEEAHAIGEELERKVEALEDVGICFVHIDYELEHLLDSEHQKKFYEAVGEKQGQKLMEAARKYRFLMLQTLQKRIIRSNATSEVSSIVGEEMIEEESDSGTEMGDTDTSSSSSY